MLVGGSNSFLFLFFINKLRNGCRQWMPVRGTCSSSFWDARGRGEIIIMQMPCCGEEESKQQMSGTAPPGKSISNTVLFVLFRASVIEYKVGSEMKHGPGTSCISSHGFQRHTAEEVAEFFHSFAADRCHRLRIATDCRHTCVSFYEIRRKRNAKNCSF